METGHLPKVTTSVILCVLLLVASLPFAHTYPYVPEEHSFLVEVTSWQDPSGKGADLIFEMNRDESRLLLIGYAAPGEVRVTDLDTGNATVLEPPSPGFLAKGAKWSHTEDRIVVWGEAQGNATIAIYDLPSLHLNTTTAWLDLVILTEVTDVSFLAYDRIVSVAGRYVNGSSHLVFIETDKPAIRWDYIWEGNHSIMEVGYNDRELIVADSGGTITLLQGTGWSQFERYRSALPGGALSWHIPWNHRWGFGDTEGRMVVSSDHPYIPEYNITVGEGPVTGFAWTFGRGLDFVTAMLLAGGGSRLDAWQLFPEMDETEVPDHLCSLDIGGNVSMMGNDPRGWSRVLVAFDDGTLASYRLDVRPKPQTYNLGEPDVPDGRGLEPFAAWHMDGTPAIDMHFAFNHAGSLIALQGFDGPNDLRVLNRTFDVVAEIQMPNDDFQLHGFEWSSTDRWLFVWGTNMKSEVSTLVVLVYDVPSFNESTSFDIELVHAATYGIFNVLFLPGDEVLAMVCSYDDHNYWIRLLDLGTGEVLSTVELPGGAYDMNWDGDNMVVISDIGGIWTLSPPYDGFNRTRVGPDAWTKTVAVNGSSGWCHIDWQYNVTVMTGTPRKEILSFDMKSDWPMTVAWTGVQGDFVLGSKRSHYGGSTLQLWRLEDGDEEDWRSVGGARLISELNTSHFVKQIAADPAFPGLMAVSFNDGTLALYHLNLTPYPNPPEELGGLDINPYIPPPDNGDGNNTNSNGLPWGSELDWVFPVALVTILVVLVAVMVVVRARTEREED